MESIKINIDIPLSVVTACIPLLCRQFTDTDTESVSTDPESFDELLKKMGVDDEGRQRAQKLKEDYIRGQGNMLDVLSFTMDYKDNLTNIDLSYIMDLFKGAEPEKPVEKPVESTQPTTTQSTTTQPAPPLDLNNMMQMFAPLMASMNKKKRRR